MKKLGMLVSILLLAFITTGCTYYNVQNSKLVQCGDDSSGTGNCNSSLFYESTDDSTFYPCNPVCNYYSAFPASSILTPSPTQSSTSSQCIPNYVYENLDDKGQSWMVLSPQQNTNTTSSPIQASFTESNSKTITVTDSEGIISSLTSSAQIPLIASITASVRNRVNHSVSQAVTVTIDNSTSLSVPAGETAYANYGVHVQVTSGHLYDKAGCEGNTSDAGTDIAYVPIDAGWCVWLSGQPPCPSIVE